jgi:hypothetical protein
MWVTSSCGGHPTQAWVRADETRASWATVLTFDTNSGAAGRVLRGDDDPLDGVRGDSLDARDE